MEEWVIELVLQLVLCAIVLLLSLTSLFKNSREQRNYQNKGMRMLAELRMNLLLLPALGIFMFGFLMFFIYLAIKDGAWEKAGDAILLCLGIALFMLVGGFLGGYVMKKRHILYDEEQILIGAAFRQYQRLKWYEISRMDIRKRNTLFLYDRSGKRRVRATADMAGYEDFYETAARHLRPEDGK